MRAFLTNRKTWKVCRIGAMLDSQKRRKHLSFHTPGHKRRGDDVTELSYTDNLASPNGCIRAAQEDIAAILGANAAFILTDGSTSGVYSMLKAAKTLGVKTVAAPVLSHKSFFNGCALLGLTPVLFETPMAATPLPVEADTVSTALSEADALFLTSPDYYGNIPDLQAIARICKAQGKRLLIDGAHGGHLHFNKAIYAGVYADFWVDGVHKSLPALTQGAVVCAKDEACGEALLDAVEFFRTSSPSYPIMASVEYAVKYPENKRLQQKTLALRKELDCLYPADDWTKLIVFVKDGFSVAKALEKRGIYAEFADENLLCFYLSPAVTNRQFAALKKQLFRLKKEGLTVAKDSVQQRHAPVELQNVTGKETEWIPLDSAEGRIAAQPLGLFPPCLALVQTGEKIEREKIARLQRAESTFGVRENKILAVKE